MIRKIPLRAGIYPDNTALANEGGFFASQWVRWRRVSADATVYAESMPGWEKATTDTFTGVARGAHAWLGRNGEGLLAWATQSKVYARVNGTMLDITPKWGEFWLTDPFSVTSGSPTITVVFNVYDADSNTSTVAPHGLSVGDTFSVDHPVTLGGRTITGNYTVVTVPDPTKLTLTHGSSFTSTASMSSQPAVWVSFPYKSGPLDGSDGVDPRINTFDSLGNRLYFVPKGGPLFAFEPEPSYPNFITNGTFTSSAGWATGSGWTIGVSQPNAASHTSGLGAGNLSQEVKNRVEPGRTYRLSFEATGGGFFIGVNAGDPAAVVQVSPEVNNGTGSFRTYAFYFQMPADPIDLVFSASNSSNATVRNISLTKADKLYRIPEAPIASDSVFVDQRGIIFLCASYQADGVFNPTCARSSGIDNDRQWVPDGDNVASEYIFTKGGRVIGGKASRGNVAIWTDDAYYTGPYTAKAGQAYNFDLAGTSCGLVSPLAMAEVGAYVFWLSPTGKPWTVTYDLQGTAPQAVECSGQRFMTDSFAPFQNGKIFACANAEHNEIWFHYASVGAGTNKEVDRVSVLSVVNGAWSYSALDRTAAVKSGVFDYPIMFSPDGRLYYHEKGEDADGEPLESYIESAPFGVGDGDTLMDYFGLVIDIKDQLGDLALSVWGQDYPRSPWYPVPVGEITPTTERVDTRFLARRIKFRIAGNAAPSKWRLGALSVDVKPKGGKRL